MADIDPQYWSIVNGKLYLNLNQKVQTMWSEAKDDFIRKADTRWPEVLNK